LAEALPQLSIGEKSPLRSKAQLTGEQTAQACDIVINVICAKTPVGCSIQVSFIAQTPISQLGTVGSTTGKLPKVQF
jgi:hypothetical protein